MSSFSRLPPELLRMICKLSEYHDHQDSPSTLSHLSQTCHKIHAIAIPILFGTISYVRYGTTRDFPPRLLDALKGLSESPHLCIHIVSFNLIGTFPFGTITTQHLDATLRQATNLKSLSFQYQDHLRSPLPSVLCSSNPPFSLERFTWSAPICDARFITEFLPTQINMLHLALLWPLTGTSLPTIPSGSLTKLCVLEIASSSLAVFKTQTKSIQYFKLAHASGVVALHDALPSVRVLNVGRLWNPSTFAFLPQLPNVAYLQTMSQLSDANLLHLSRTSAPLRCIRCTDIPDPEYTHNMGSIISRLFEQIPTLDWVEQRFDPNYNENTCLRWYRDRTFPALVQWDDWQHAWLDDWDYGCEVLLEEVSLSIAHLYGSLVTPCLRRMYKLLRERARKPRIFRRRYGVS